MRTEEEVRALLERVLLDARLREPDANVFAKPRLALIQTKLKTTEQLLRWILEDDVESEETDGDVST